MGGAAGGRRPTLDDVAAVAGVSRAMVSIVLRGAAGSRPATREKVLAAAERVGYRPDARARLLASGSARQIGVVLGLSGRFHAELLDGLYRAAGAVGHELILSAMTPERDERAAVETLLDFRCEAAILLGHDLDRVPVVAGRMPVTVVGCRVPDPSVDVVRTADPVGMRLLADHLAGAGHTRIAHVDGGSGPIASSRRSAYRTALRERGLRAGGVVVPGGDSLDAGVRAARALLRLPELPTAVIGFNDDVAAGLVEGLLACGVRVPDDVSVTGWDDSALARLPEAGLTTVRQDPDELARLAVGRSVARLRGERPEPREIVLTPELVVRGSTAHPPPDT
ncbi:transcriptional regulator, LacI family [Pseudonocardia sp. Ae168_Ps1]|uniref:LacI family DNA-binding transcriptional regulator n=1 Tax=unclassified Pseudonocardia TaxID=2619320 RepID=UPI00094AF572|nr:MULTISPECIES: LacI family DNA-binding transcriptional regulator [unclassified Pseudonocardia]OLL71693.1 transcriptional regulator, LacI family [Pseudonocardia sp. Ae150A_Ps1]OLL77668.1 transcriptional regulator, LacI family [Pseudonocardia sp. Ae168_Ps1]OLL88209.1 transcriptional regulator, LacI family [Pseudonocardia sp. Ae263_Ps1]OLL91761.1 transcriptional regulator, LacI family [Pseudonocardia sp. Ae356_Ps1]